MAKQWVLITDTNIWVDLENGGILKEVFHLPYRFLVPDFAIREFHSPKWETLSKQGLIAQVLEPALIIELIRWTTVYRGLSLVDLAAFVLAKHLGGVLLTGDRQLRILSTSNGIPVHGIFWLLDELVSHGILSPHQAADALERVTDRNARLPYEECQKRLAQWRKA